ncbi:MAG: hypothetical protein M1828_002894 [Chrysothrix sp. TS-e1954]|nr:MAG: hypothetical protein M1828_002894 [Chrysothrix sp. TS-e1954]
MAPRPKVAAHSSTGSSKQGKQLEGEKSPHRRGHETLQSAIVPLSLQNSILQAFCRAFPKLLNPNTTEAILFPVLQRVKQHLYNRDFDAAFGCTENLEAYAVRWSPGRALGYLEIFSVILRLVQCDFDHLESGAVTAPAFVDKQPNTSGRTLRVVCLGGGAGAEAAAFWALQLISKDDALDKSTVAYDTKLTIFDVADWQPVLDRLKECLVANGEAAEIERPSFGMTAYRVDLLFFPLSKSLIDSLGTARLVTLMFTLNEMYTASIGKTQRLLLELSRRMAPKALLLIVDSPGSYSTVKLGGKEKQYPMAWLLEHALLHKATEAEVEIEREAANRDSTASAQSTRCRTVEPVWQELRSSASVWWRQPQGLKYPVQIENMRYQLHLYRKLR